MTRLSRVHIGKIERDPYQPMTIPKMLEAYSPVADILDWLDKRNCKIEFENYKDARTMMYVDVIVALMDDETYLEYRLTWK